jgi:NTE family protein
VVALRSGTQVSKRLRAAFGEREIDDLPVPFFCVSSNLSDGALEVHEHGLLWTWLRASSAIPGILPPVLSAGRVLVDGGVIDNLPVGEMRKRLAGSIVAIDVGGEYRLHAGHDETELPAWWRQLPDLFRRGSRPRIGEILLRSGMVNSAATASRRRKQTRLLLSPPLDGIGLLDWQAFDRAVAAGYDHARRELDRRQGSVD